MAHKASHPYSLRIASGFVLRHLRARCVLCRSSKVPAVELVGSSIELFSNRITDSDVFALVDVIMSGLVVVEALYLCVNSVTDEGAAALASLFQVRVTSARVTAHNPMMFITPPLAIRRMHLRVYTHSSGTPED